MEHDIVRLEEKVRELDKGLKDLAAQDVSTKWGHIIHGPGWTTLAEFALVEGAIETLQEHVQAIHNHLNKLSSAAETVGR